MYSRLPFEMTPAPQIVLTWWRLYSCRPRWSKKELKTMKSLTLSSTAATDSSRWVVGPSGVKSYNRNGWVFCHSDIIKKSLFKKHTFKPNRIFYNIFYKFASMSFIDHWGEFLFIFFMSFVSLLLQETTEKH